MTQEQRQTILDLSKTLIFDLTVELNKEVKKINTGSSPVINIEALVNCDEIIVKIKNRIDQLKSVTPIP